MFHQAGILLFRRAQTTAHAGDLHPMLFEEPADPPAGIGRLDLQPRTDVFRRKEMRHGKQPRTFGGRSACARIRGGRKTVTLASQASIQFA